MNGAQALKVRAVSHSEIKCCKKHFKKYTYIHTYNTNHYYTFSVAHYSAQALFYAPVVIWRAPVTAVTNLRGSIKFSD
jgi:hypothetical protein